LGAPILCRWFRASSADAELFDRHGTEFFANVKALFEDDATPIEILRVLGAVGRCVSNKRGPARLYHVFANSRELLEFTDDDRRRRKVIAEFLAQRPELEARYLAALWHGFLATSYRSVRYGTAIRDHLVGIETPERKQDVAFAIRSASDKRPADECKMMAPA
jgi:hypothetical protein